MIRPVPLKVSTITGCPLNSMYAIETFDCVIVFSQKINVDLLTRDFPKQKIKVLPNFGKFKLTYSVTDDSM